MGNFPKGSEWRKWDLHFHTPSSYDYKDKSIGNLDIVNGWKSKEISVVAITDHHIIDIDRFNELSIAARKEGITVLPGIEFCSDSRGDEPLHFIGIFDEDAKIEFIWAEINSKSEILKQKNEGRKDNEIYCDFIKTCKLIRDLGGIISVHAGSKTNSIENITNALPTSMAQKSDIVKYIDIFEIGKIKDQEGYVKQVFPVIKKHIPMILCSDNHNIKNYALKSDLWIKADPTFRGLRYIIQEPIERIYIGQVPLVLERVNQNKTKYISELYIDTIDGKEDLQEIWFKTVNIKLNSELVAIIGNKGSGKSALTDIIGLCTDAEHQDDFIFLNKDKFKIKGFADRFYAKLQYASNTQTKDRSLFDNINPNDVPKVQYLPQNYFENVCNEIGKVEYFRKEIEKVVFQYIPEDIKMKKSSFNELIAFRKESIESEILNLKKQIEAISQEIMLLEDKKNPQYLEVLNNKKVTKEEELEIHQNIKPVEIKNPLITDNSVEAVEQRNILKKWEDDLVLLNTQVKRLEEDIYKANIENAELKPFKRDIENKISEMQGFIKTKQDIATKYSLVY